MMGGAVGLAALASWADMRTGALERMGIATAAALNGGYHLAFWVGALFTACAALLAVFMQRSRVTAAEAPSAATPG
jgi:hypothetical protein